MENRVAERAAPPNFTGRERAGILTVWTVLGLMESAKAWVNRRLGPQPLDWPTVLIGNMPWWLAWALLTPAVIALARRVRPDGGIVRFTGLHVLAATVLSLLHHAVVGILYFHTHTRGTVVGFNGTPVEMTIGMQFRIFFAGYFMLNIVTYTMILVGYYGYEFYRRYREGELRAARLEVGMQRARLAALRMELNPHFLFNTLNAVTGFVRRNEGDSAIGMLARLSDLLRATLEQGSDPEVPLEKELDLLGTYLDIERIRFGDRLHVEVHADAEARAALVPPLILQPLVENAVKHGIARHVGHGRIEVVATRRGGALEVSVSNTGPAEATSQDDPQSEAHGIGLSNTRERLSELYGMSGSVQLELLPAGGARAVIRLPFRADVGGEAVLLGREPVPR